jgi:hypothetical protein
MDHHCGHLNGLFINPNVMLLDGGTTAMLLIIYTLDGTLGIHVDMIRRLSGIVLIIVHRLEAVLSRQELTWGSNITICVITNISLIYSTLFFWGVRQGSDPYLPPSPGALDYNIIWTVSSGLRFIDK